MFKRLSRDIEDFFCKTQIQLLEMKTVICEMKNALDGINSRSDIEEENFSEFEDRTIESI